MKADMERMDAWEGLMNVRGPRPRNEEGLSLGGESAMNQESQAVKIVVRKDPHGLWTAECDRVRSLEYIGSTTRAGAVGSLILRNPELFGIAIEVEVQQERPTPEEGGLGRS